MRPRGIASRKEMSVEEGVVLDIARDGIWMMLLLSMPALMVAMVVGLVIAIFQTLTQIQEMTLIFVPKIVLVFLTVLVTLPWSVHQIGDFTRRLMMIAVQLPGGGT